LIITGPDYTRARIIVDGQSVPEPINEFDEFWQARYLTATEATFRLFGFHIATKYPSVSSLPVHTQVTARHSQYSRNSGTSSNMSLLRRYFHRPDGTFIFENEEKTFNDLTYSEYFRIFRLEKWEGPERVNNTTRFSEHNFPLNEPRQTVVMRTHNNKHITRLAAAKPSEGERFYIRSLLQRRPARSFEDLRTVDGTIYPTFQRAAIALGLFVSHQEAEFAMTEAVANSYTPHQLRRLFIDILVNECTDTPVLLWEQFARNLQLDHQLRLGSDEQAAESCLQNLSKMLEEHGRSLDDFGLPTPNAISDRSEVEHELERWLDRQIQLQSNSDTAYHSFNYDQLAIFNCIVDAVETRSSLLLFIDGKAGRGKTYLLNAVCDRLRSNGKVVLATAISAFAAQLYKGGRTTHSTFKVSVIYILSMNFIDLNSRFL
jgi:hypothetical protein